MKLFHKDEEQEKISGGEQREPHYNPTDKRPDYNEAVAYFRNRPGFNRLFCALKEKYRSLGTLGGVIFLSDLAPEERTDLAGFLRRDFRGKSKAVIKVTELTTALTRTKFHHLNLEEIFHGYWGKELLSKKEEHSLYLQARERYFLNVVQELPSAAARWLKDILEQKENAYKILITRYYQNREVLSRDLKAVGKALAELPALTGNTTQLALFSSKITTDPHYFDKTGPARQLLIYALTHYFQTDKPESSFAEAELLYKAGLINTEIANFTICCGLLARRNENEIHPGWAGFYRSGETIQLSLENLSHIKEVFSPTGYVLALENPAVFSALADRWRREKNKAETNNNEKNSAGFDREITILPMVCANGQINLATMVLLEQLTKNGAILYYSGDFDPEGLLIADRLKARFGKAFRLWRYKAEDYAKTVSDRRLSAGRLKQLERLQYDTLREVGREILNRGYAGYQELLIDDLWRDIGDKVIETDGV